MLVVYLQFVLYTLANNNGAMRRQWHGKLTKGEEGGTGKTLFESHAILTMKETGRYRMYASLQ